VVAGVSRLVSTLTGHSELLRTPRGTDTAQTVPEALLLAVQERSRSEAAFVRNFASRRHASRSTRSSAEPATTSEELGDRRVQSSRRPLGSA
jgi:hypothetical protein